MLKKIKMQKNKDKDKDKGDSKMRTASKIYIAVIASLVFSPLVSKAADTPVTSGKDAYTGVLENKDNKNIKYQLIPNEMAVFCKTSAEKIANDPQEINRCINKILQKLKNNNAEIQTAGKEEFNKIQIEETERLVAKSVAKSAVVPNYEQIQEDQSEAADNTANEHEDNLLTADSINVYSSFVNSLRDLYTERLKSDALYKLQFIDLNKVQDIIAAETPASESSSSTQTASSDTQSGGTDTSSATLSLSSSSANSGAVAENMKIFEGKTYTKENPMVSEWVWSVNDMCERQVCTGTGHVMTELDCETEFKTCEDGIYKSKVGSEDIVCKNGKCIRQHDVDDVAETIENEKPDASSGQQDDAQNNERRKRVFNWVKNAGLDVKNDTPSSPLPSGLELPH